MASIGAMGDLLKQAQEMQSRMAKIQEELASESVQGSSGGGMVQVTVNGQCNITAVRIEPSVINSNEKEMLEDLVLAAVNDGVQVAGADTRSNAASAADSAFVWDDSLDDSLAAAQNAIHDVRGGWNRGYGQVDTLLTRLQEYQQDLSENSL